MFPQISNLTKFVDLNPNFKLLISRIQESNDDFWLVGGCLRNFLLDLPQTDVDIACTGDPTPLARSWCAEVSGRWFWLDSKRKQSRVLLQNGLTFDFTPLRAPSITEDLQLRDFTVNALALPLDIEFPDSEFLDPLGGSNHLQLKELHSCSQRSFLDDPLRMLKGIRHAVTLDLSISEQTRREILVSAYLLDSVAGERIRDEFGKIIASDNVVSGIELLTDTGLLEVLFGPAGLDWDSRTAINEIGHLDMKIQGVCLAKERGLSKAGTSELYSIRAVYLMARLLKKYSPNDLSVLLHSRLRLSRNLQRLLVELQTEPDSGLISLASLLEGQRQQALLVEQMQPFAYEKLLYWGVCSDRLELQCVLKLQESFIAEQKVGRIPDLLSGRLIASLLNNSSNVQIGKWHSALKQAEINGEIGTTSEAEDWLKNELSFDNKEL